MIPKGIIILFKILPRKQVVSISKLLVRGKLRKYANISVINEQGLIAAKRPTIIVCNHLSNSDGIVLSHVLRHIDPTFVAGVKLSKNAVTNVGINAVKTTNIRPNSADVEGIKKAVALVESGESLLIFPEGTRSRTGELIEAKKGILLLAKMTGVPILPIGIHGSEILLPINQSGDMSQEVFQKADVTVNIGEQFYIPPKSVNQSKKEYEEYAKTYIMNKIAELIPETYRGVYR